MNQESSRSHCIFTIKIQIKELNEANGEEVVKVGKLNLVDLAGSENVERSGATKRRAAEAGNINKSLLALARVIKDLASHSGYISYRESKLTRLLQESLGLFFFFLFLFPGIPVAPPFFALCTTHGVLIYSSGGKAKTCMIATISPSGEYLEDTLSTLDYAHQARNIRNQPQINQTIGKKVMINQLQNELDMYRQKLEDQYEKNGVYIPTEKHQEMLRSLSALQESEALLQKSVLGKSDELESWKKNYHQIAAKLEKTEEELKHTGTLPFFLSFLSFFPFSLFPFIFKKAFHTSSCRGGIGIYTRNFVFYSGRTRPATNICERERLPPRPTQIL